MKRYDVRPRSAIAFGGDESTNDLSISFHDQGKTCDFTSVTHMKSGATLTYEGTGKR